MLEFDQASHPELLPGEVWYANDVPGAYHSIMWSYKRQGINAYDSDGKIIPELAPIFVLKNRE